jgi:hypothetical protein
MQHAVFVSPGDVKHTNFKDAMVFYKKHVVEFQQTAQSMVWQKYFSFTNDVFGRLKNTFYSTRASFCDYFMDYDYILLTNGYWYKVRFNKDTGEWEHSLKFTKIEKHYFVVYSEIKGREEILEKLTTLDFLKKHLGKDILQKEDIADLLSTFATVHSVRIDFNVKLENVRLYMEYYTFDEWKTIYHLGTCSVCGVGAFDRAFLLSRYLPDIIVPARSKALQALKSISEKTYEKLISTKQVLDVNYFEEVMEDSFLEPGIPVRYKKFLERAKERIQKKYKGLVADDGTYIQLYRQLLHLEMEEFGELMNSEDTEFM